MPSLGWNASNLSVVGYSKHELHKEALQLFEQMHKLGMTLDWVILVVVVFARTQAGLMDEGSMGWDHCNAPKVQHYAPGVDLLGHAGCLNEAYALIKKFPLFPSWMEKLGCNPLMDAPEYICSWSVQIPRSRPRLYEFMSLWIKYLKGI